MSGNPAGNTLLTARSHYSFTRPPFVFTVVYLLLLPLGKLI